VREFNLGSVLNGGNSAPGGDNRAPAKEWLETLLAQQSFPTILALARQMIQI